MDETDSHKQVVPGSDDDLTTADVQGYEFRGEFDFQDLLDSYATTGFQATQLAEAIDIAKRMQEADATIYLTCTSNIISSGLREVVASLVREGYIDVLITTSGGLTEDVIKTSHPFKMGEWETDESALREKGINRLGNIFVPSDRYVWLEEYLYEFFDEFFAEESVRTPTAFARELGATLDDENSVLKQAAEHDVPVYCPALTDAEVGNFLYFYRQRHDAEIDIKLLDDYERLIEGGMDADTTGLIAVGDGVPKHHAIMTNLFRGGADYAVYISTGMEGDGSLSGAPPDEAVSWGKIKEDETNYTQVQAEATLVFPLLVAGAFVQ